MIDYSALLQQGQTMYPPPATSIAIAAQPKEEFQGLRAYDPATGQEVQGTLDPNKRYNLKFFKETTTAQADPRAYTDYQLRQTLPMARIDTALNTDEQYKADYELGKTAALNKYLEQTKMANDLPPQAPQGATIHALAQAELTANMAKLNQKKDAWENKLKILQQNPNMKQEQRDEMAYKAYEADPVYKHPMDKAPKPFGAGFVDAEGNRIQPMVDSDGKVTPMNMGKAAPAGSSGRNAPFQQGATLRKELTGLPSFKNYGVIRTQEAGIAAALDMVNDPRLMSRVATDQAIIMNFNKILDPTSVVRESEYDRTPETVGIVNRLKAYLPKLEKGGVGITPMDLKSIADLSAKLVEIQKRNLNQDVNRYVGIAKGYNLDPMQVYGDLGLIGLDMSQGQPMKTQPSISGPAPHEATVEELIAAAKKGGKR